MLLSQAERRLGLAERLAAVIPDERDASRVIHRLPDILRARILAIACGYEDVGIRSAVSVPASKPPPRASTFASSPPAFTPAQPSTPMRPSTAPAATTMKGAGDGPCK